MEGKKILRLGVAKLVHDCFKLRKKGSLEELVRKANSQVKGNINSYEQLHNYAEERNFKVNNHILKIISLNKLIRLCEEISQENNYSIPVVEGHLGLERIEDLLGRGVEQEREIERIAEEDRNQRKIKVEPAEKKFKVGVERLYDYILINYDFHNNRLENLKKEYGITAKVHRKGGSRFVALSLENTEVETFEKAVKYIKSIVDSGVNPDSFFICNKRIEKKGIGRLEFIQRLKKSTSCHSKRSLTAKS